MDFSVIFQLRTKKFWWMDVILYFVISLLIATVLCWLIFLAKNSFQREDIKKETVALQMVGTGQQKGYEKEVIAYRGKINDFAELLKNHEFSSNAFAFMQAQTLQNVWFKQFGLDEKNSTVQLSGQADDADTFSRQVAAFERNKYVKSIGTLNSSLGKSAKIEFNINLALDQDIFSYLSSALSISETTAPTNQPLVQQSQAPPANNAVTNPATASQQITGTPSSEKLITSFRLLLTPQVEGQLDQTNYTVTLNVPYGADIKNLTPSIVISPGATVLPSSHVSQDFTNPVIYIVTAQDGSVQDYKVTVIVSPPPQAAKKSNLSKYIALIIILLVIIAVAAAVFSFIKRKKHVN